MSVPRSELINPKIRSAQILIHLMFVVLCALIVVPLALTLVVSFSSESSVIRNGYTFFPDAWSLDAYKFILKDGSIFRAYLVTIGVTVSGTVISVFLSSMCGFVISQSRVKYRGAIAMFLFIPTVVSSGLVPWFYLIKEILKLSNTYIVLVLPSLVSVFNIFLVRNYYKGLPPSLAESAEIDGAGPFTVFLRIILPLGLPITATISLFTALGYWNDFMPATWFIDYNHQNMYPLQYYLYKLVDRMVNTNSASGPPPSETVFIATMFITMGPIILVYPFAQRFFIKGITVGGVKG